jgi:hypothetical protein
MVTLVGWVAILVGLFRMFAPEVQQASHSDMHKDRSACQSQKLMPYSKDLRLME